MSCHLCEDFDISFLVQYAMDNDLIFRIEGFRDLPKEEIGSRLFTTNLGSVDTKYGDDNSKVPPFKWDTLAEIAEYSPMQVIVSAQHFGYQCANFAQYDGSNMERLILYIINHATHKLPGYDDAKWGHLPKPKIQKIGFGK